PRSYWPTSSPAEFMTLTCRLDVVAGKSMNPETTPLPANVAVADGTTTDRPTMAEACNACEERNCVTAPETVDDIFCISSNELNCASCEINWPLSCGLSGS